MVASLSPWQPLALSTGFHLKEEEARQRARAPLKLVPGDTQTRASWAGFHMSVTLGRRRKRAGICMGWGHSTFCDLWGHLRLSKPALKPQRLWLNLISQQHRAVWWCFKRGLVSFSNRLCSLTKYKISQSNLISKWILHHVTSRVFVTNSSWNSFGLFWVLKWF